jgi:DNA-binding transcriptional MerR regulator
MTDPPVPDAEPRLRIGEAAVLAGVSARTLRYYQEIGLLTPAGTTVGGARRYSEADVARVGRIRHLRDLVGLDLNEVGRVLAAEDRLAAIRREWFEDQGTRRQVALLEEAGQINTEVQEIVRAKMRGLEEFLAGLEERSANYRRKLREIEGAALSRS